MCMCMFSIHLYFNLFLFLSFKRYNKNSVRVCVCGYIKFNLHEIVIYFKIKFKKYKIKKLLP